MGSARGRCILLGLHIQVAPCAQLSWTKLHLVLTESHVMLPDLSCPPAMPGSAAAGVAVLVVLHSEQPGADRSVDLTGLLRVSA